MGMPALMLARSIIEIQINNNSLWSKTKSWVLTKNIFSFSMMIGLSVFGVLFYRLLRLFSGETESLIGALLIVLSPPLSSMGILFFPDFPTAFILCFSFYRYLANRPFHWVEAFLIGFLPWLSFRNYLAAVVMLGVRIYGLNKPLISRRFVFSCLLVFSVWGSLLLFNYLLWGVFSPTSAWSFLPYKTFDLKYIFTALPGLILDRSCGLLAYAPFYGLVPMGFLLICQKEKRVGIVLILLLFSLLFPVSGYPQWWAGWCPAARYLTPCAPFLALLAYVAITTLLQGEIKVMKIFASLTMGWTLLASVLYWNRPQTLWNAENGSNRFLTSYLGLWGEKVQCLLPNFFGQEISPHVFDVNRWGELHGLALGLILLVLNIMLFRGVKLEK
jgi:hypothetical protein